MDAFENIKQSSEILNEENLDFAMQTSHFLVDTLKTMARLLPNKIQIDPVFCPNEKNIDIGNIAYDVQYGWKTGQTMEKHSSWFTAALPLPTAVRYLLDGKSARHDEYISLLRGHFTDYFKTPLAELLRREPQAIAFCHGLDNHVDWEYPACKRKIMPEAIHASTDPINHSPGPRYINWYTKGREAAKYIGKENIATGKEWQFGIIYDYLCIAMEIENGNIICNIGFSDKPSPSSDDLQYMREIDTRDVDSPESLGLKIMTYFQPEQRLQEETQESPSMQM